MSGWRTYRIADLGRVVTGKTPPSSQPELFDGAIPFITPSDMSFDHRHISTERSVSADWDSKQRTLLPEGAVCVVCIGATIGKICMSSKPSQTNQQVNSVIVDQARFDQQFVYYGLRTKAGELMARAAGAATPIINKTAFSEVEIDAPPLETQLRIASILGAYDDLIEVNRRRIAVLEEMARGLFEEWFVRFRFPGHEAVPILDTPDGPLPEGWEQTAFGSLLEHTIGGLWGEASETATNDQRVSIIRGTDFPKLLAGNYAGVPDRFVSNRELASRALRSGDLILEASGGSKDQPVGRVLYVTASLIERLRSPVAPASFCRLLRPNDKIGVGAYLYGLLQAMYQDKRIEKFQKQSTGLRNLSMKQLAAETVTVPDVAVLVSFSRATVPLLEAASLHRHECKALGESRDLLLPRLISGQLSVTEAERELEAIA